jgi:hypothetical protein
VEFCAKRLQCTEQGAEIRACLRLFDLHYPSTVHAYDLRELCLGESKGTAQPSDALTQVLSGSDSHEVLSRLSVWGGYPFFGNIFWKVIYN